MGYAPFREAAYLSKNGVPFHVALGLAGSEDLSLPPLMRTGFAIIFGELEGGKFNWSRMDWDEAAST